MSLVQDLEITLKDLLPKDGLKLIAIAPDGHQVAISNRLYDSLKAHAVHTGISLTAAMRALQDEIHSA
jgi:hypothetical protein